MQHNAVGQCILLAALMMTSLLAALMMIDLNGPDIEAAGRSEGANSGICQCVEELQEEGAIKGQTRGPCAQKRPCDDECLL
jgi:hypothetical protein